MLFSVASGDQTVAKWRVNFGIIFIRRPDRVISIQYEDEMLMEHQVKFYCPRNISGASQ